jgi:hypothetical protein
LANATPARTPSRKIASTTTTVERFTTPSSGRCLSGSSQPASGGCITVFGCAWAPWPLAHHHCVGRFDTAEAAQLATDEVLAAR